MSMGWLFRRGSVQVKIMDGDTVVAGFDTTAQEGGRAFTWPVHVWADLAGSLRGREHANLNMRVIAPTMRQEGVVLGMPATREQESTTA